MRSSLFGMDVILEPHRRCAWVNSSCHLAKTIRRSNVIHDSYDFCTTVRSISRLEQARPMIIRTDFFSSKILGKRDDFDFDMVNLRLLDGDVPLSISYGFSFHDLFRLLEYLVV